MKVFIVEESLAYEGSWVCGVFATLERAIAEVRELESRHRNMNDDYLNEAVVYNRTNGHNTIQVVAHTVQE